MTNIKHKTLTTETEITAYLHRLRIAILDVLRDTPATSSQITTKLGVHPANLTRHIRTLKDAGLITLVEKRDTGRNLEKYYQAVASSFDVAVEANNLKAPHKIGLAFARSDISAALTHLPDEETQPVIALVTRVRISADNIKRFNKALAKLVKSFSEAKCESDEPYHLNVCLYPAVMDLPEDMSVRLERK